MTAASKPIKKTKLKRKVETVTSLHKKLWSIFSRFIRLRDCIRTTGTKTHGRCITCNKLKEYSDLQAGHFITRRAKSILYHEKNVHAQCEYCNHWGHGEPLKYQDKLIKMYGTITVQILRAEEHSRRQWKKFELLALIQEYTQKVKELERTGSHND